MVGEEQGEWVVVHKAAVRKGVVEPGEWVVVRRAAAVWEVLVQEALVAAVREVPVQEGLAAAGRVE